MQILVIISGIFGVIFSKIAVNAVMISSATYKTVFNNSGVKSKITVNSSGNTALIPLIIPLIPSKREGNISAINCGKSTDTYDVSFVIAEMTFGRKSLILGIILLNAVEIESTNSVHNAPISAFGFIKPATKFSQEPLTILKEPYIVPAASLAVVPVIPILS